MGTISSIGLRQVLQKTKYFVPTQFFSIPFHKQSKVIDLLDPNRNYSAILATLQWPRSYDWVDPSIPGFLYCSYYNIELVIVLNIDHVNGILLAGRYAIRFDQNCGHSIVFKSKWWLKIIRGETIRVKSVVFCCFGWYCVFKAIEITTKC